MKRFLKRALAVLIAVLILASSLCFVTGAEDNTVSQKKFKSLSGLKVLFFGDSITRAKSDGRGWPARLNDMYGFREYLNEGVSGSTIAGEAGNRIITPVRNCYKMHTDTDLVILHGGTNDAWQGFPLGEISEGFDVKNVDVGTTAGALEYLLFHTKRMYPNAGVGFIVNFKFVGANSKLDNMQNYVDTIIAILEKWEVPYVDLYHNAELEAKLKPQETTNFNNGDHVHPNAKGYDIITPYIASWLEETFVEKEVATTAPETTAEPTSAQETTAEQTSVQETTLASSGGCNATVIAVVPAIAVAALAFGKRKKY
jgi:lysophospholipase L1-like esterase